MWIPKTESEIIEVVTAKSLAETISFDAKKELPGKNQEIAKDIAAMANDGGVIIFGIGEDENKRLSILNPIPLAGEPEKIDAIVRSAIVEPPSIQISTIPTEKDPSKGYIIVLIPPSERAPHMVVVKGEHRYYGRTCTGNFPLNEGDVARLYARRQKTENDRQKLIEEVIEKSPIAPNSNFAYLYLFTQPVFSREDFFAQATVNGDDLPTNFNKAFEQFVSSKQSVMNKNGSFFDKPHHWQKEFSGYFGNLGYESQNKERIPAQTIELHISNNGDCRFFYGRAGEKYNDNPISIFCENIVGVTFRFLGSIGRLFDQSKYYGMVDTGVVITGIRGGLVYSNNWEVEIRRSPINEDTYQRTLRISNHQLLEETECITKQLLGPFVETISKGLIDPFK